MIRAEIEFLAVRFLREQMNTKVQGMVGRRKICIDYVTLNSVIFNNTVVVSQGSDVTTVHSLLLNFDSTLDDGQVGARVIIYIKLHVHYTLTR